MADQGQWFLHLHSTYLVLLRSENFLINHQQKILVYWEEKKQQFVNNSWQPVHITTEAKWVGYFVNDQIYYS